MKRGSGGWKHRSLVVAFAALAGLPPVSAGASEIFFSRLEPITAPLSAPGAVAVDASGNVYVSEAGHNRVVIFDAQGTHRKTLVGLTKPISLAIDGDGRVYVGNAGRGNVEIYGPELTLRGKLGAGDGEFGQPSGIAVGGDGTVYVADSTENLVKVYRPDGTRESVIGGDPAAGVAFKFPAALAIDAAAGELIVTDLWDNFLSRSEYGGARVQVFSTGGAPLRSFGHFGRGDGLLVKPLGVTTDGAGKIYVTDAFQNVVEVFDRGGSYLGVVHDAAHPLRTPLGTAFDRRSGKLYVCSLMAGKVEVFDMNPPAQSASLTVSNAGNGVGTVTSEPAGIACPGVCSAEFPAGSTVTLTAAAGFGFAFAGWSGACVGTGACMLTMSQDLCATPRFEAATPARRVASDFNGDGLSDILRIDRASDRVAIWLIDRDLLPHAFPVASAQRQRLGGVADVGGDGKADILWHSENGTVTLWSMDGAAIGGMHKVGPLKPPPWKIAGLADFDNDGRADVLWRNTRTGSLRLWLLADNAVGAESSIDTAQEPRWAIAAVADFDGDGCADILWRHNRTRSLRLWFMNGARVLRVVSPGRSPGREANFAGSGDFDGDGRADLLWRASADGSFSFWPMAEGQDAATVALANSPDTRWRLLKTGDYDGDGRADLLVRRRSGTRLNVCLTAEAATLRCAALNAAPGATAGK